MHGTTIEKLNRVAHSLLSSPANFRRYVQALPVRGRQPLQLGLPWMSFAAIDYLERTVGPDTRVFEWGSGGSTLFFARRAGTVVSVESDPGWCELVRAELRKIGAAKANVMLEPLPDDPRDGFAESSYVRAVEEGEYDLIVVDGREHGSSLRPICFRAAERRMRPGCRIILDDSWRYAELRSSSGAARVEVFQSVGPCRYGVTSTDVYQY